MSSTEPTAAVGITTSAAAAVTEHNPKKKKSSEKGFHIPGRTAEGMHVWFNIDTLTTADVRRLQAFWIIVVMGAWLLVLALSSRQLSCYDFCNIGGGAGGGAGAGGGGGGAVCDRDDIEPAYCVNFSSTTLRSSTGLQSAFGDVLQRSRRILFRLPEPLNESLILNYSEIFHNVTIRFLSSNSSAPNKNNTGDNDSATSASPPSPSHPLILSEIVNPRVVFSGTLISIKIPDNFDADTSADSLLIQLPRPLPQSLSAALPPAIDIMSMDRDYIIAELILRYIMLGFSISVGFVFVLGHASRDTVRINLQEFALGALTKEYAFAIALHFCLCIVFPDPLIAAAYFLPANAGLSWWSGHGTYLIVVSFLLFGSCFIVFSLRDAGATFRKLMRTRAIFFASAAMSWYVVVEVVATLNSLAISELLFGFTTSTASTADATAEGAVFVGGRLLLAFGVGIIAAILFIFWRSRHKIFFGKGVVTYRGKARLRALAVRLLLYLALLFIVVFLAVGVPVQLYLSNAVPVLGRTALGDVFVATVFGNLALWFFGVKSHRVSVAPESPHVRWMRVFYKKRKEKEEADGEDEEGEDEDEDEEKKEEDGKRENKQIDDGVVDDDVDEVPVITMQPPTGENLNRVATATAAADANDKNENSSSKKKKKRRIGSFRAAVGTAALGDNNQNEKWTPENFEFIAKRSSSGFYFATEREKIAFDDAHAFTVRSRSFFCFETAIRALNVSEVVYYDAPENLLHLLEDGTLNPCTERLHTFLDCCCGGNTSAEGDQTREEHEQEEREQQKEKENKNNENGVRDDADDDASRGDTTKDAERSIFEAELYGYKLLRLLKVADVQVCIALFAPTGAVGPSLSHSLPGRWAPDMGETGAAAAAASDYSCDGGDDAGKGVEMLSRRNKQSHRVDKQFSTNTSFSSPPSAKASQPASQIPEAVTLAARPETPPTFPVASPSRLSAASAASGARSVSPTAVALSKRTDPGHRRRGSGSDFARAVGDKFLCVPAEKPPTPTAVDSKSNKSSSSSSSNEPFLETTTPAPAAVAAAKREEPQEQDQEQQQQQEFSTIAHVAVVFRGTHTKRNAATDCDCFVTTVRNQMRTRSASGQKPALHAGFASVWNNVEEPLLQALDHYLTLLRHPKMPIFCCGHSSGGAVACIAADVFAQKFPPHPVSAYTFAAPRFANAAWRENYMKRVPETYRVVAENDIVTRLPTPGAVHVGREVVIDRDGNFIVEGGGLERFFAPLVGGGNSISNHSLNRYAQFFAAVFKSDNLRLPFKTFLQHVDDGDFESKALKRGGGGRGGDDDDDDDQQQHGLLSSRSSSPIAASVSSASGSGAGGGAGGGSTMILQSSSSNTTTMTTIATRWQARVEGETVSDQVARRSGRSTSPAASSSFASFPAAASASSSAAAAAVPSNSSFVSASSAAESTTTTSVVLQENESFSFHREEHDDDDDIHDDLPTPPRRSVKASTAKNKEEEEEDVNVDDEILEVSTSTIVATSSSIAGAAAATASEQKRND